MTTLVFSHGWGCDAHLWDAVRTRLGTPPSLSVDWGFYGQAQPLPHPLPEDAILVGHSLGFARALPLHNWAGLVAVNGFPRFTRDKDFPAGVAPRLLQRMIDRFDETPHEVTQEFLLRCGLKNPDTNNLCHSLLQQGLQELMTIDVRAVLAQQSCPIRVLAGREDLIVPPAMTEASLANHRIDWQETGDHMLPLSAPDWVADQIRTLL